MLFLSLALHVPPKAYSTIPLPGKSDVVRCSFYNSVGNFYQTWLKFLPGDDSYFIRKIDKNLCCITVDNFGPPRYMKILLYDV